MDIFPFIMGWFIGNMFLLMCWLLFTLIKDLIAAWNNELK